MAQNHLPPRVAVLDDDPGMQILLGRILNHDFLPQIYTTGKDLLIGLQEQSCDIVLLDLGLRGEDGLDILREIRLCHRMPVIIVSGKGHADIVETGLNLGADDYVTKPFVPAVLCARIRTVLRRSSIDAKDKVTLSEDLTVPLLNNLFLPAQRLLVSGNGQHYLLTERESQILRILCDKSPGISSRDEIMRSVTGTGWDPSIRSLDVHVCRIRSKLASATNDNLVIDSIRGVGYRLRRATASQDAAGPGQAPNGRSGPGERPGPEAPPGPGNWPDLSNRETA